MVIYLCIIPSCIYNPLVILYSQKASPPHTPKGDNTMKEFKVIYSYIGFDCTAYFDSAIDYDAFATMMAEQGRLVRAIAHGEDRTEMYVSVIKI